MRIKLLLATAATFFTLAASAAAQGIDAGRVDIVGAQPKQARIAAFTFHGVQGHYELDDGRILSVTGTRDGDKRTLYADFGDGPTEIVPVGKYRFVAIGKDVRLVFERAEHRRVPDIVRITSPDGRELGLAQR